MDKIEHFCKFNGPVGECGVFVGYSQGLCAFHRDKKETVKREKVGKYSGPSKHQEENGSWVGLKRGF